jgi:hypothetical protein
MTVIAYRVQKMGNLYKQDAKQTEIFFEKNLSFFVQSGMESYLKFLVHHNSNQGRQFQLSVVVSLTCGEGSSYAG